MIFKSTYEILNNVWSTQNPRLPSKVPPEWNSDNKITVDDVVIWEQVYHQPGNLGIYVAWSPRAEFYLVVYDLFRNTPAGIRTFEGPLAVEEILNLAEKLEIKLPISRLPI